MKETVLVILAGGLSRRYQNKNDSKGWQDKAFMPVNKIPLLIRLLREGFLLYSDVCISVNSQTRKEKYIELLKKFRFKKIPHMVVDKTSALLEGSLKGISTAIEEYPDRYIQLVSCDRPHLSLSILNRMVCSEDGVSLFHYDNGVMEPLLALYGSKSHFPPPFAQLPLSRADVVVRLSSTLHLYNASQLINQNNLSPDVFLNVNYPVKEEFSEIDYKTLSTVDFPPSVPIKRKPLAVNQTLRAENLLEYIGILIEQQYYYEAFLWSLYSYNQSNLSKSNFNNLGETSLSQEYEFWIQNEMPFLALHALQDIRLHYPDKFTVKQEHSLRFKKTYEHIFKEILVKPVFCCYLLTSNVFNEIILHSILHYYTLYSYFPRF